MVPEIKKILYATDLSKNARYAFGYAASLANRYDAKITVVHVLEDVSSSSMSLVSHIIGEKRWVELKQKHIQEVLDMNREHLSQFCSEVSESFKECPFIVEDIIAKQGEAVQVILNLVENADYDIVVVGSHGHGILAGALMGGTSRRIVRRCKKPVLVVRLPEDDS